MLGTVICLQNSLDLLAKSVIFPQGYLPFRSLQHFYCHVSPRSARDISNGDYRRGFLAFQLFGHAGGKMVQIEKQLERGILEFLLHKELPDFPKALTAGLLLTTR